VYQFRVQELGFQYQTNSGVQELGVQYHTILDSGTGYSVPYQIRIQELDVQYHSSSGFRCGTFRIMNCFSGPAEVISVEILTKKTDELSHLEALFIYK
jgi:hypothetical protein